MSVVLTMTSQDTYSALSITIGMTRCKLLPLIIAECPHILFSVRAKLRNADPGFDFTSSFFLRCLYENESGDADSPGVGFLRGPLLIRVSSFHFVCSFED
jgi:hypothetical protein